MERCDFKTHNECTCQDVCTIQHPGEWTRRAKQINLERARHDRQTRKEGFAIVVVAVIGLALICMSWVFVGAPAQHRIDLAQQENTNR